MINLSCETLDRKTTKYQPLINNIITKARNATPFMILVAGARTTTHIPSMRNLETKLKLPILKIKNTFKTTICTLNTSF